MNTPVPGDIESEIDRLEALPLDERASEVTRLVEDMERRLEEAAIREGAKNPPTPEG